jgi:hypothetical protein
MHNFASVASRLFALALSHGYAIFSLSLLAILVLVLVFVAGPIISYDSLHICRSDCNDYDTLSNYVAEHFRPYSGETAAKLVGHGDHHGKLFFEGFTTYVGILKILFGPFWDIAFVVVNGALLALLAIVATRINHPRQVTNWKPIIIVLAIGGNVMGVVTSRLLLTDYFYALLTLLALLLLAHGLAKSIWKPLIVALVLSMFLLFVRPVGLFVFGLAVLANLGHLIFRGTKLSQWIPVGLLLTGLIGMLAVAGVTVGVAQREAGDIQFDDDLLSTISDLTARVNVRGGSETRVNEPASAWIINYGNIPSVTFAHRGEFQAIVQSFVYRIYRNFDIRHPGFSARHNFYRMIYNPALYIGSIIAIVFALKRGKQYSAIPILAVLVGAYLMLVSSIQHIEYRYLLVIQFAMAIMASFAFIELLFLFARSRFPSFIEDVDISEI